MSQKGKTRCPPIIVIVALILFLLSLPSAQAAPLWTEYGTVTARIEDVRYEESIYENQTHTRTYYTIKIIYFHDFKDNFKTDRASRGDVIEGLVMGPNSDLDCEEGEYITTDLVYFQDEWNAHWDLENVEGTSNPYVPITFWCFGVIITLFIPFYYHKKRKREAEAKKD